jgi:hypothetical protein
VGWGGRLIWGRAWAATATGKKAEGGISELVSVRLIRIWT